MSVGPFGTALVVVLATGIAVLATRWLPRADGPPPTAPERIPFLGGGVPEVHAWSRFHIRYYAMALLFLAFDMEMAFMYPWAVVYRELGLTALLDMGVFLVILFLGMLYGWSEGALRRQ